MKKNPASRQFCESNFQARIANEDFGKPVNKSLKGEHVIIL
jgi:hypothetical protein